METIKNSIFCLFLLPYELAYALTIHETIIFIDIVYTHFF
jgi:hypothetical protein